MQVKIPSQILDWLEELGVPAELIEPCKSYLQLQPGSETVLSALPEIDMNDPQHDDLWEDVARQDYYLRSHLVKATRERMFQLLYRMGGHSALDRLGHIMRGDRGEMLDLIYAQEGASFAPVLIEYLHDQSRPVREKAAELLVNHRELDTQVGPLIFHRLKHVRDGAVYAVYLWGDEKGRDLLERAYLREKNEGVRMHMALFLGYIAGEVRKDDAETEQKILSLQTNKLLVEHCTKQLKRIRKQFIHWLDFETLPVLHFADDGEPAPDEVRRYLLISYAEMTQPGANLEAEAMQKLLRDEDVRELAMQTFLQWEAAECDGKRKWVLSFALATQDPRLRQRIQAHIEAWPKQKRVQLAVYAVKVLGMSDQQEAWVIVDTVRRKIKNRLVKEAAVDQFQAVANRLGMDIEELADRMVPTLGFDANGEQTLDFGTREFRLRLTPELGVSLFDATGKELKSLPKPNRQDDAERAAVAKLEFTQLKKQLRQWGQQLSQRFAAAAESNRTWSQEQWNELFAGENPILREFAKQIRWKPLEDGRIGIEPEPEPVSSPPDADPEVSAQ
ncbi:DUF4132 domain-containing protein [Tumebacillus flagellatus]|uniref:DUF4132 domain-containing protein n=1 Tax=Tumebacillus flagellatus TaxID=1157490 RepID=A0A074LNX4_9BACL|nr:DUF4132 domain-containing protein [Tumebacillus flagellatus]KEO83871.1 hypothetical protein EL26_08110 [Tumebacillus flagellatus]